MEVKSLASAPKVCRCATLRVHEAAWDSGWGVPFSIFMRVGWADLTLESRSSKPWQHYQFRTQVSDASRVHELRLRNHAAGDEALNALGIRQVEPLSLKPWSPSAPYTSNSESPLGTPKRTERRTLESLIFP